MKIVVKISLIIFILVSCVSCVTTSTYGDTFEPSVIAEDTYSLKIFYGGPPPQFASSINYQESAESALYKKALEFMTANPKYKSYNVVKIDHSFIPSYYRYDVKFSRE